MNESRKIILGDWRLKFSYKNENFDIEATVPGNVEIDLQREGIITNPFPQDDTTAMREFEMIDWEYETTIQAPELETGDTIELVFEGIDTVADIYLGDEKIYHCENMFIPHSVDLTGKLKPGEKKSLKVKILSAELYARKFPFIPGESSREHRHQEAFLRKARHMWGWDNAPRLLSAGIWRDAYLEIKPDIRFMDVYIYTNKVFDDYAAVGIDWTIDTPDIDLSAYTGKAIFSFAGKVEYEKSFIVDFTSGSLRRELTLKNPRLWWPAGYGNPDLYDVQLILYKDNQQVAQWNTKFGVREIELIRTEKTDKEGSGEFVFRCNGEKIYIRGTNWKPVTPIHSQTPQKMRKALELCVDLHCNMVRVWGGGIYEDHEFFDFCDEHGLLVWQDFMIACGMPPQDEFFQKAMEIEAISIVKRLRNHTSLALWCGDNETDQAFFWGLLIPPKMLPSDNLISRQVLKRVVKMYDPYCDYMDSSPYISDEVAQMRWEDPDCRLKMVPEQHLYLGKRILIDKCNAHFVSETGACCMSESPEVVIPELERAERLWNTEHDVESELLMDGCESHQLDGYFMNWKKKTRNALEYFFQKEFPIEPWQELALAVNIFGGDYYKSAVEHFRMGKWRRTGMILWSLVDMWPMMFNSSLVDSCYKKKLSYYFVRQSQQLLCMMARETDAGDMAVSSTGQTKLYAANDTLNNYNGTYRILQLMDDGEKREIAAGDFTVESNRTSLIMELPTPALQALLIFEWTVDNKTSYNHFITGKPPYDFKKYKYWISELRGLYESF